MIAKDIYDLIRARLPLGICDDCIARELDLSTSSVQRVTEPLAMTSDFTRYPALCPSCGKQREVIRASVTIRPSG